VEMVAVLFGCGVILTFSGQPLFDKVEAWLDQLEKEEIYEQEREKVVKKSRKKQQQTRKK
jgi:hypothetical protein